MDKVFFIHSMLTTWLLWMQINFSLNYPRAISAGSPSLSFSVFHPRSSSKFQLIKKFCKNSDCIISLEWKRTRIIVVGERDACWMLYLRRYLAVLILKLCHFAFIGWLSQAPASAAAQCVKLRGWLRGSFSHRRHSASSVVVVVVSCVGMKLNFLTFWKWIFCFSACKYFFVSSSQGVTKKAQWKTFEINSNFPLSNLLLSFCLIISSN